MISQQPLNEGSSAFAISKVDKVFYLRFGQLQGRDRFGDLGRLRQVIDEGVGSERQNDFRGRELSEYSGDQRHLHLGISGLIEKEDRPSRTRLPTMNGLKNALNLVLERTCADDDPVFVDLVAALCENLSEMVGMCHFFVDEIELAVDVQRLVAFSVQSLGCR